MATVKTVLRKRKLAEGSYPISLRVCKDRKSKYFQTIFRAFPMEWNQAKGNFTGKNSNNIQNNRLLLKFKDRALKILSDLEMEKSDFTLKDFENRFRIIHNPVQQNVFYFWNEIMEEFIFAGRTGNARANKGCYNSLKKFNKSTQLNFKEITPSFLYKYEAFLRSRGGSDGGIGVRMRTIRALYNFAIERKIAKELEYPFKIYKVSKLKGRSLKKALTLEEVLKIRNLDLKKYPWLVNTRHYFIFSFYTRGMNFADMMKLEWKDTDQDKIYYKRSKTKGNFKIKIVLPVQEILNHYKEFAIDTKYVFPILLNNNMTPPQLENRKHKTLIRYNKELKEIAVICGIDKNLTSYVARHSFANCLKQKGVATDIISESMGHQNLAVTQAYLKEFDNSVLDDAIEILV
ncbi:site-specific recombinase XerD [Gelidibacter algens]|uniref:Site-specific recombinase XerD n=1 Tax=Gelidibacter algens TaxID=49280 RepID=A0A327SA14_9FLAO|nr:site-specific integrase [Gelidibacter algens]RAJ24503.1 site-specific recombinase XerD [Gelidibacter algens]